MEMETCAICLDPINADDEAKPCTKMPSCGHLFHFECLLHSAWKGNIGCPTCRKLPLAVDRDDVLINRDDAIDNHNEAEMQRFFTMGLRKSNSANASSKLKKAVNRWHKHQERKAQIKKNEAYTKATHKEMRDEITKFTRKLKDKYKAKVDKAGFNGAACMSRFEVHPCTRFKSLSTASDRPIKRCIARAAGWRPVHEV